jgi:hypothetical protein
MKQVTKRGTKSISLFLNGMLLILFPFITFAQITTYQYRHVPDDKIGDFIYRETTYWSEVAKKAIEAKKMTFWALLEKVGGYDLPNSSNYLFINTFSNVDSAGMSDIWNPQKLFPNVPMSHIETNSISTTTSQFFLHGENWVQDAKAVPAQDFNYVVMVYHNTNYTDSLIALENKHWAPFIKKAMDGNQTPQMAWGNARVLAPFGDNIKFTTVSYDLYKTLQDALMPNWDPKTVFPNEGLTQINNLELNRRGISVYRIVKVQSAN